MIRHLILLLISTDVLLFLLYRHKETIALVIVRLSIIRHGKVVELSSIDPIVRQLPRRRLVVHRRGSQSPPVVMAALDPGLPALHLNELGH